MKCINELREIGVEHISTKTRITQDKIVDIIECRFENFDKTRAKGFIQIIQREFNIDLSEWSNAYDEYHSEKMQQIEDSETKEDNIDTKINIPIQSDVKDKSYMKLIAFFILLVALFIAYFIYNNFYAQNTPSDANATTSLESNLDSTALDSTNDNATLIIPSNLEAESNATVPTNDALDDSNLDSNTQDSSLDATNSNLDSNNTPKPNASLDSTLNTDELIITPKEPLWIGVIDLSTYQKKQVSSTDSYTIKLDNNKLIRTGHSHFDIKAPNLEKQYMGGNNKYFLFTIQDGLKEISKKEFLELNRGDEW